MPRDVFISYSSVDKQTADAVCHALEAEGLRCWIAPRDAAPGHHYQGSIVRAIRECDVMVLVFSSHANASGYVLREVSIASDEGKPVIPFRIEAEAMSDDLYFLIGSVHWLDALTPPLSQHIQRLVASVAKITSDVRVDPDPAPPSVPIQAPAPHEPEGGGAEGGGDEETPLGMPRERPGVQFWQSMWSERRPIIVVAAVVLAAVLIAVIWPAGPSPREVTRQGIDAYEARQFEEALQLFERAAEDGDGVAQLYLGRMYRRGNGVERDASAAVQWTRAAQTTLEAEAEEGDVEAQYELGRMYEYDLDHRDDAEEEAEVWYKRAAEQEYAPAQVALGSLYRDDDVLEAWRWYRLAAEQGDADGQYYLGEFYVNEGNGEEGARWLRSAAEQGHPRAMGDLGDLYYRGRAGVSEDLREAARWYLQGAEHEDYESMVQLGQMYHEGQGVDRDFDQAARWFTASLESPVIYDPVPSTYLGSMYERGEGVEQDRDKALKHYQNAVFLGNREAQRDVERLQRQSGAGSDAQDREGAEGQHTCEGSGGKLSGRVVDSADNTPLPGAIVWFPGTNVGAAADEEGRFELRGTPVGYCELWVQYVGYEGIKTHIWLSEQRRDTTFTLQQDQLNPGVWGRPR